MRPSGAAVLVLAACGTGAPPRLPPEAPTPWTAVSAAPLAVLGDLLRDRKLGTSGYACADCHALAEPALRPGPPLGGAVERRGFWGGLTDSPAVAANLCVERWLARPALDGANLGALVNAMGALPAAERSSSEPAVEPLPDLPEGDRARGVTLYDQACRDCHENGPAGALWGRRWARGELIRIVRGVDRPRHPGTLMPAFDTAALPDAALADLATALAESAPPGM